MKLKSVKSIIQMGKLIGYDFPGHLFFRNYWTLCQIQDNIILSDELQMVDDILTFLENYFIREC